MTEHQKAAFLQEEEPSLETIRRTSRTTQVNFGTLYLGLTLIILGLTYYYGAAYMSSLRVMVSYARLWPLAMIVLGLTLYRSRSRSTFAVGVLISLLAVMTTVTTVLVQDDRLELKNAQYTVPSNPNIQESNILIENPAGKLTILGGSSEGRFIDAYYESNYADFVPANIEKENTYLISLSQRDLWQGVGNYYKSMTARLSDSVPTSLTVRGTAMSTVMDLSSVQLRELDVTVQASDLNLTLGNTVERSDISIDSAASAITIFYPADVGVEIIYDGTLTTTNFDGFDGLNTEPEGVYRSENYNESISRSRLTISANVSRVTVVQQ